MPPSKLQKWWVPVVKLNYKLHKQIFTMLCYTLCGAHSCVHFSKRTISNDDPRGVFRWTFGQFLIWWKQRISKRRTVEYVRKRGAKYFGLRLENCGLLKTCLRSMTVTTLSRVWVEFQSNLSPSKALCYQNLLFCCVFGALKIPSKNLNCIFPLVVCNVVKCCAYQMVLMMCF